MCGVWSVRYRQGRMRGVFMVYLSSILWQGIEVGRNEEYGG